LDGLGGMNQSLGCTNKTGNGARLQFPGPSSLALPFLRETRPKTPSPFAAGAERDTLPLPHLGWVSHTVTAARSVIDTPTDARCHQVKFIAAQAQPSKRRQRCAKGDESRLEHPGSLKKQLRTLDSEEAIANLGLPAHVCRRTWGWSLPSTRH
jgi:hypothetical protein